MYMMRLIYAVTIDEPFQNGNTPVVMIAHSMGCPMSLYFLNQQTKDWKDKYIRSLVTLAGPWGGSVVSLQIFAVGTDLGLGTSLPIPIPSGLVTDIKDITRFIERTQPSLAWMMPSEDIWSGDPLIKTESNSVDYTTANLADYFNLVGVPNMAMMYQDAQKLTSSLVDPGVEVCNGHGYEKEGKKNYCLGFLFLWNWCSHNGANCLLRSTSVLSPNF